MPAARSRASAAAGLPAQRASAARRPLRRVAKAASTTAKVARRSPGGRRPPDQGDQPGVDVRLGPEDPPADGAGPAHLAVPGGLDRGDAVGRRRPGGAASRSATSAWTSTSARSQRRAAAPAGSAAPGRRCCTAGSPPAPSAAGPGSSWMRSASASTTVSRSARSGRRAATVDAAAGRPAAGRSPRRRRGAAAGSRPEGQRAQARADLEDDVVGPEVGGAHDPPDRVRVVQEVLPERLGRPQVELLGQLADRGGAQQPVGLLGWGAQRGPDQSNRWRPQRATGRRRRGRTSVCAAGGLLAPARRRSGCPAPPYAAPGAERELVQPP